MSALPQENRAPTTPGDRVSRSAGSGAAALFLVVAAGYLLVGGYLVCLGRNQVNPDGVAYVQIARHYAHGRFDLAVAGHWGPLLSWLLLPAVWLDWNLLLTAKVLGVVFGLGCAMAVARLVQSFNQGRGVLLAFTATCLLVLTMLPDPVTPDVLLSCLIAWYLVVSFRMVEGASPGRGFAAGVLGGVAYLAKHYALPFVVAHLAMTFVIRAVQVRRGRASGPLFAPFLAAAGGLLLVALPWIAVISIRERAPTIGSTARHTRAFSPLAFDKPLPLYRLQNPRAGRITSWENPAEIPYEWPNWSPFSGWTGLRDQALVACALTCNALTYLRNLDLLAILVSGFFWSLVALAAGGRLIRQGERARLSWLLASAAIYVGGYVLIYVEARLLWPVVGMLVALAIGLVGLIARAADGSAQPAQERPGNGRGRLLRRVFGACLLVSVSHSAALTVYDWARPGGKSAWWDWFESSARQLGVAGPVAANEWHMGLFVAYFNDRPYLGKFDGDTPEKIADELADYGPASVVVFNDPRLSAEIKTCPWYAERGQTKGPYGRSTMAIFELKRGHPPSHNADTRAEP